MYMIVMPQLSGGWQHNYSTKTRQAAMSKSSLSILLCLWVAINYHAVNKLSIL
jgi:hypothetical protein